MPQLPTIAGRIRQAISGSFPPAGLARVHATLAQVQRERDSLREALAVARQQVEVAVALGALLSERIDAEADVLLVVADVVWQWRVLTPGAQAAYGLTDNFPSPLVEFAWDYYKSVRQGWADILPDEPFDLAAANRALSQRWQARVARLRAGQAAPLPRQKVLVGPGDFAFTRAATEEERQRCGLPPEQAAVLHVWPATGDVAVHGAREYEFRQRVNGAAR